MKIRWIVSKEEGVSDWPPPPHPPFQASFNYFSFEASRVKLQKYIAFDLKHAFNW